MQRQREAQYGFAIRGIVCTQLFTRSQSTYAGVVEAAELTTTNSATQQHRNSQHTSGVGECSVIDCPLPVPQPLGASTSASGCFGM